jgi:hypothetical protein
VPTARICADGQNLCRPPPSAQPRSPSAQQSSRRHSLAVGTEPPGPTAAVGTLWPSAQTLSVPTARSLAVGTWLYGGATDSHRQRRQQVANGVKWADGQAVGTASPPNFLLPALIRANFSRHFLCRPTARPSAQVPAIFPPPSLPPFFPRPFSPANYSRRFSPRRPIYSYVFSTLTSATTFLSSSKKHHRIL